jgi:hypothetical protein
MTVLFALTTRGLFDHKTMVDKTKITARRKPVMLFVDVK